MIIVIPCFNEDNIFSTFQSIIACNKPNCSIEIITVINYPENASPEVKSKNETLYRECQSWAAFNSSDKLTFYFLFAPDLRKKYAGAGWARKIGMDEAVYRFVQNADKKGIICSLDADVTIEPDYLVEIQKFFDNYPNADACSIYFEHNIQGNEFAEDIYESIIYYELYLRYYIEGLRISGYPYAYHTIGSCFAVRACSYASQGGMNKRQGGEDFYFLHKIIPLGNYYELNSTCVHPSPRPSNRVPFGTGPAISKYLKIKDKAKDIITYNLDAFFDLRKYFSIIDQFFKISVEEFNMIASGLPANISSFLKDIEFEKLIQEINGNAAEIKNFRNRFYHNFNALVILRYLNYSHQTYYSHKPLLEQVRKLLNKIYGKKNDGDAAVLLSELRRIQKEGASANFLQQ
ncbi:MAG: hypothetical protein JXB49_19090 [Bacteroidales bacterium]|nr:hypothetical protein [Bacteroidales bacterium]